MLVIEIPLRRRPLSQSLSTMTSSFSLLTATQEVVSDYSLEHETQMEAMEGVIVWLTIEDQIVQKFPGMIGSEPRSTTKACILNFDRCIWQNSRKYLAYDV